MQHIDLLTAVEAYRKQYVPPTSRTPLIVRAIDYAGEEHPAAVKRSVVVPVAHLPLRGEDAIHKAKLLAGPRWTPDAPANAGVGRDEPGSEHGYIKISCEDFPKPAMNLKWASDVLDALISEANVSNFFCQVRVNDLRQTNILAESHRLVQGRTVGYQSCVRQSTEGEERGASPESSRTPTVIKRLS
jgi:small subunit ribosomal protein S35